LADVFQRLRIKL